MSTVQDAKAAPSTAEDLFYKPAGETAAPPAEIPNSETPESGAVETEAVTEPAEQEQEPEAKSPRLSWRELRTAREKAEERAARAEARAELLEQQAKERKQAESSPAKPETKVSEGKPKEEDFKTFGEYLDARDAWNRAEWDRTQAEKQRQADETKAKDEEAKAKKATAERWNSGVEAFKATLHQEDKPFESVAYSEQLPINPATHFFILKSPIGANVLYALGSDLKEGVRISKLDEHETYVALVKLESEIQAKLEAKGSNPKVTQAPRPARAVTGTPGVRKEKSMEEIFYPERT